MRLAIIVLALASCAATRAAGVRRMGAARLEGCIRERLCPRDVECFAEARAFCADAGMERGCAYGEPEGLVPCNGEMRR